jgi:hypothetical protein
LPFLPKAGSHRLEHRLKTERALRPHDAARDQIL